MDCKKRIEKNRFLKINDAISFLEKEIANSREGLPEEIFLFISQLTPIVNVDLLLKEQKGRTLLSWRDDQFAGRGWHVPGGIVRFKESFEEKVLAVAKKEIGTEVKFDPIPIAINQIICKTNSRGHFISILYKCFVPGEYVPKNKGLSRNDSGYLMWHKSCPKNLVNVHKKIYKKYIDNINVPYSDCRIGLYRINR